MLPCRGVVSSNRSFVLYGRSFPLARVLPERIHSDGQLKMRIPECLAPGKFNFFGSSHQLFHILVVLATVVHLIGLVSAFGFNYHHRVCTILLR